MVRVVINESQHGHLCYTPKMTYEERHAKVGFGCLWPVLTDEVKAWCDHNTPGFTVENNRAANFIIDVVFKSERDAVLFKTFWL